MGINTDNEGNAIATQRNLGQRYRGLYKRENRCSDGFGDVGKYGSDDGWGTVETKETHLTLPIRISRKPFPMMIV